MREEPNIADTCHQGYNQTYLIKTTGDVDKNDTCASRDAFLRCGNWCYSGQVKISYQQAFETSLKDIPHLVPKIQKQGGDLSYLCKAADIPPTSTYHGPLLAFESARDAVISELTTDETIAKVASFAKEYAWIDDGRVYFELVGNASHLFPDILFICSKVYSRDGVIFNIIYFEGTIYVTMDDATDGEQPLIDVNFPDISLESNGAVLSMYDNDSPWMKLSIWQIQTSRVCIEANLSQQDREADLSSDCYTQSYCILKSESRSDDREVMFRFGSWCYSGTVELASVLTLKDLPLLIPLLRLQQSRLSFVSDVSKLSSGTFAFALEYASAVVSAMEEEAIASEDMIESLIKRAHLDRNEHWLESDDTVYEFECDHISILDRVEMMLTKTYRPNGLVSISVYYGGSFFFVLSNDDSEQLLLDTKFPDLAARGNGCLIHSYSGLSKWPQLRKMRIWELCPDDDSLEDVSAEESLESLIKDSDPMLSSRIEEFSTCSCASSTTNQPVTNELMDILDDAMLDICNTFDDVLIDCGLDAVDKMAPNNHDRAFKLSILEKKLAEIKSRTKEEEDQRAWDDKGRPVNITQSQKL